jgi:hypothetical protein
MIEYKGQLNLGNEILGTEKTITANEVVRTADTQALAREIHHQNALIPEQVAKAVLDNFCAAACELMAMGFAVQFANGDDVAMRIYPDIHVKGGNINLKRAKELDPSVTDLTVENAGELIDKAGGVTVRVRATVQQKFTEMLMKQDVKIQRTDVSEVPYVERTNDGNGTQAPTNNGGGNSGGNNGGDNGGNDDEPDEN